MSQIKELTEEEIGAIIIDVARRVAKKFRFGYHGDEDMVQQGALLGWRALAENKFTYGEDTSKEGVAKRLAGFMATHMRNRLFNYRRNCSCRYESKNNKYNVSKYNLMHPVKMGEAMEEMFAYDDENKQEYKDELIKNLRTKLPPDMVKDFVKLQNGVSITARRRDALIKEMRRINEGKEEQQAGN